MDNFLIVAGQVAILFALMGVGAVLRWTKLLSDAAVEGLVNLLILIVTPCLIVDVFQRPYSPAMLKGLAIAFVIAVLGHVAVIAAAYLFVRHRNEDIRRPMMLAAVFSNAGFMGLPLEQAVLGDAGVFYGVVYIVVFNLFMWSWGYNMMKDGRYGRDSAGRRHSCRRENPDGDDFSATSISTAATGMSPPRLLQRRMSCVGQSPFSLFFNLHSLVNPGTIGIACGLPLFFLSVKLPAIVGTPVHLLAGLNTPVAMIVIGYCLAGAKIGAAVRVPAIHVAAFIRLIAYPLLVVAAMFPFRHQFERDMMLSVAIAASAPVAAMVSMFATKFRRDVDTAVAVVSGTTLLSIVTMPAVIALAMAVL